MGERNLTLSTVDMHTAGEPVRIVEAGYPVLAGATILEKRRHAREHHDFLRRTLMFEPRGHAGMYGVIPTEPCHPDADLSVLFTHLEGYSTMCGHATIAIGRWAVDSGRIAMHDGRASFRLEAPCGLIDVAVRHGGDGARVSFESVESFASHLDREVDIPGFGRITLDIGYGGAFFAILPSSRLGLPLMSTPLDRLVAAGVAVTNATREAVKVEHPREPDLAFLYGTILTDEVTPGVDDRPSHNLCIFAEGQIDRSPTGSGVTARIALAAARGDMQIGQSCTFRGISGESFAGTLSRRTETPEGIVSRVTVEGTAYYTGRHQFICEPGDPFAHGFELPDRFRP